MKHAVLVFLGIVSVALAPDAVQGATIHKCIGPDGKATYTDRECAGAAAESSSSSSATRATAEPVDQNSRNARVTKRINAQLRTSEAKKCDSGDASACQMVTCLDLDSKPQTEQQTFTCKQTFDSWEYKYIRDARASAAAGRPYENPVANLWLKTEREVFSEDCARGDKSSCEKLKDAPASVHEMTAEVEAIKQKQRAACETGEPTLNNSASCMLLFCDDDRMTDKCRSILQRNGRPVGANWYLLESSGDSWGREQKLALQCFDARGSWIARLQCVPANSGPNTCAGAEARIDKAAPPVSLQQAGDQVCRR